MSAVEFCLSFSKMTTYIPNLTNQQAIMPSLKPHAQSHLLSPTDKCKICAEPAARHIHYGATTCFSCRAFFRQSLQNYTAAKYVCMRHSMCEMALKTRKNCQYCRYLKCLAVGMNPNYVLSEEERKRRFKKRNNSNSEEVSIEEPTTVVPVVLSVTVNTTEENVEPDEISDDRAMPITDNKTGYCNQVFQKQEEISNNNYHAFETISFPQKYQDFDTEMKHSTNYSPQKTFVETYFDQNVKAVCQPVQGESNPIRRSIIIRNVTNFPKTEVSTVKDAFIGKEYKHSVIQGDKTFENEEKNTYFSNEIKPMLRSPTFPTLLTNQNLENIKTNCYSSNAGMPFKEIEQDQISDNNTSSDSEEEIAKKIMFSNEPEIIFTEDEKHQLDKLVNDHDTVYHSVNFGEVLIKEMLMCSMFGVSVSTSAAIQGYRLQVERITRIANSLKCFTDLRKVDQIALLKENADLLVSLRGALFFDKKKRGMDQVMSSMGIEDREIIKKMFKPLIQAHTMNHIDYAVFNSIQDPAAKKIEERYSFLQGKVADSILDNSTTILMTYIILFSSDFCSLEDKRTVEKTQYHYLRILERCIYSASSRFRACTKMAHTLNAITCVREMADIKKSRAINHSATAQIKA